MTLAQLRRVAEAAILKYPNIYPNVEIDAEDLLHILDLLDEMAGALEAADATLPYDTHLREMAHATIDNALAKYNELNEK